jgi:hypothetical protein
MISATLNSPRHLAKLTYISAIINGRYTDECKTQAQKSIATHHFEPSDLRLVNSSSNAMVQARMLRKRTSRLEMTYDVAQRPAALLGLHNIFFGIHAIVQSKIDISPLNGTLGDLPNARMKSGNALPTPWQSTVLSTTCGLPFQHFHPAWSSLPPFCFQAVHQAGLLPPTCTKVGTCDCSAMEYGTGIVYGRHLDADVVYQEDAVSAVLWAMDSCGQSRCQIDKLAHRRQRETVPMASNGLFKSIHTRYCAVIALKAPSQQTEVEIHAKAPSWQRRSPDLHLFLFLDL